MLIFVCSPMRGDRPYTTAKYNRNMRAAAQYSKTVVNEGHIPITPHLFFKDFMDDHDPEEREKALEMSKQLLERCDEKYLATDGKPDVEKMKLITLDPIHNGYIVLGERVGNAYHDGNQLKK